MTYEQLIQEQPYLLKQLPSQGFTYFGAQVGSEYGNIAMASGLFEIRDVKVSKKFDPRGFIQYIVLK